jgi:alanine racemase
MMRHVRTERTRGWVDVDLGAVRQNGAMLAERAGVPLLPMVKADGYGLGSVQVARALETIHPWGFGVASVDEGIELRSAGIDRPIVVFTPLLPTVLPAAADARLTPSLGNAMSIARWAALTDAAWHLAIDTGMNRAGVPWDEVGGVLDAVASNPPEGAYTHFHSADANDGSLEQQERRFCDAVSRLPTRPRLLHVDNGAAVERRRGTPWDLVRPGVFLYGVGSGEGAQVQPRPVVHLRARVVDLRVVHDGETVSYLRTYRAVGERRIATLPIGYADGYRRALSNRGAVLLTGRRATVSGLVTMDMTMVDVTRLPCAIGDTATLIGTDGEDVLDIATVARAADISPYELLTGLRGRLPRHYDDVDNP